MAIFLRFFRDGDLIIAVYRMIIKSPSRKNHCQKQLKSPIPNELVEELGHGVYELLDLNGGLERVVQEDRRLAAAEERHTNKGRVHP